MSRATRSVSAGASEVLDHNETGSWFQGNRLRGAPARRAYSRLKFESGVHGACSGVPETEAQGRIHICRVCGGAPEADDVEVEINENDSRSTSIEAPARAVRA